jgi:hypothetical protein
MHSQNHLSILTKKKKKKTISLPCGCVDFSTPTKRKKKKKLRYRDGFENAFKHFSYGINSYAATSAKKHNIE